MVFGDKHVPWDERVVARELLEEITQRAQNR
jgi:hypothetical protein